MSTSVAQASANAIAAWLQASLRPDVTVLARWPTGTTLPVNTDGRVKVVSVTKVGSRRRFDGEIPLLPLASTAIDTATARMTFAVGGFEQPIQLDVWCGYDGDREDLIDQLDDVLNQGVDKTISSELTDDPVRDGITLPLAEENGYVPYIDCWFDEPEITDDPTSIQGVEFRAMYSGTVRGTLTRVRDVPILKVATPRITSP